MRLQVRKPNPALRLSCCLLVGVTVGVAHAALVLSLREVDGDVVGTVSGSVILDGLTVSGEGTGAPRVSGGEGAVLIGGAAGAASYVGIHGPAEFGSSDSRFPTVFMGDLAGVKGSTGELFLSGYPEPLGDGRFRVGNCTGSCTWTGETFASLEVRPGTYTWWWGSGEYTDYAVLQIGVPELPANLPVTACGLLAVCLGRRRLRASHPCGARSPGIHDHTLATPPIR
jgi:hypothetical protein